MADIRIFKCQQCGNEESLSTVFNFEVCSMCRGNLFLKDYKPKMKTPLEAFQEFYDVVKSSELVYRPDGDKFSFYDYNGLRIFSWRNGMGSYRVFEMGFSQEDGHLSWTDIELPYG